MDAAKSESDRRVHGEARREIETRAATVERLFMISERREWTLGETLEYALDELELTTAKTVVEPFALPFGALSPAP
jgi:hypothetical protein